VFPSSEHPFSAYNRFTRVKILNQRGFAFANVLIPYDPESQVSGIRARAILPDGRAVPLSGRDVYDTNLYPDFLFYSDHRAKRFSVPGVEPGSIVEVGWQETLRHFSFWSRWDFQSEFPVLRSILTVRCPNDWDLLWKAYGIEIRPEVEKLPRGMKANHVWKAERLEPFRREPAMPPGGNEAAHLLFSSVGLKTWDDVALWYRSLCAGRLDADAAIRSKTLELAQGADGSRENLRRIFEFVRDRIRYVAVEIGIGGYQPHPAAEVFFNRYGDCKDMAALIVAMAGAAGIEAHPALVSTWQNGPVDTSLVSQAQFNHAIAVAVLPEGTVFMDATDKDCAFGDVPWYDRDRLVFDVPPAGKAGFVRTPAVGEGRDRLARTWILEADSTGRGRGRVTMTFSGAPAAEMRSRLDRLSGRETREWTAGQLLLRFPAGRCDSSAVRLLDAPEKPLVLEAWFSQSDFLAPTQDGFAFQPGAIALYDLNLAFSDTSRNFPVAIAFPSVLTDSILLRIPDAWTDAIGPSSGRDSCKAADYEWRLFTDGPGTVRYVRRLDIRGAGVEPADYPPFRQFVHRVAQADRAAWVFRIR
jgi:hypothetical protein